MLWATIDKEGVAIVSTFRRLDHFLWNRVDIFSYHPNLAYSFDPEACVTSVSKTLPQRLEGWNGVLGQYRYTICNIPGDPNAWGDLLSRWVRVPALPVRAVAVFRPCDQDDSMPKRSFVKRNRMHLRRMARRCNLLSRPLALLSWTMRVCFAFMRVADMSCGFRIVTSSCKCA